jgi:hypothetical protein
MSPNVFGSKVLIPAHQSRFEILTLSLTLQAVKMFENLSIRNSKKPFRFVVPDLRKTNFKVHQPKREESNRELEGGKTST